MVISCPFCGASTGLPHESQEACIAALQEEIALTREFVERTRPTPDVVSGDDRRAETDPERAD